MKTQLINRGVIMSTLEFLNLDSSSKWRGDLGRDDHFLVCWNLFLNRLAFDVGVSMFVCDLTINVRLIFANCDASEHKWCNSIPLPSFADVSSYSPNLGICTICHLPRCNYEVYSTFEKHPLPDGTHSLPNNSPSSSGDLTSFFFTLGKL